MDQLIYDLFESEELHQRELRLSRDEAERFKATGATVHKLDFPPDADGKSWYLIILNR